MQNAARHERAGRREGERLGAKCCQCAYRLGGSVVARSRHPVNRADAARGCPVMASHPPQVMPVAVRAVIVSGWSTRVMHRWLALRRWGRVVAGLHGNLLCAAMVWSDSTHYTLLKRCGARAYTAGAERVPRVRIVYNQARVTGRLAILK